MNKLERAMPLSACPKCRAVDAVRSKLIAVNFAVPSFCGFYEPYGVTDEHQFLSLPYTHADYFISSLSCAAYDVGFIPDALLPELGIERSTTRPSIGQRTRPFGVGVPMPDAST